jgi:phosphate-selective porin OprO and OprP|tara:strand:- start:2567 stop:3775 length:1209 start_codon:yes stop_codon:yes gene_type:complete
MLSNHSCLAKYSLLLSVTILLSFEISAQKKGISSRTEIGEGIKFTARDKSYDVHLYGWGQTIAHTEFPIKSNLNLQELEYGLGVTHARTGLRGYLIQPELLFHFQMEFVNSGDQIRNDIQGIQFNGLLDAFIEWNIYKGFNFSVGQRFVPGTRASTTPIRNLQFAGRSTFDAFSGFTRDAGLFVWYDFESNGALIRTIGAVTQGEGANVQVNSGGLAYTARADWFPFGEFTDNGQLTQGDLEKERAPKLQLGGGVEFNDNSVRENGHLGDLVMVERDILTYFADVLFKYQGFAFQADFVDKEVDIPVVYDTLFNTIGIFNSGMAFGGSGSYMLADDISLAIRYHRLMPTPVTKRITSDNYGIALSKYFAGHNVKVQTDIALQVLDNDTDPNFQWQLLMSFGF